MARKPVRPDPKPYQIRNGTEVWRDVTPRKGDGTIDRRVGRSETRTLAAVATSPAEAKLLMNLLNRKGE